MPSDEVEFPHEDSVLDDGSVVVYDRDEDDNLVGWHKQPPAGEEHPVDGPEMEIVPDTSSEGGEA